MLESLHIKFYTIFITEIAHTQRMHFHNKKLTQKWKSLRPSVLSPPPTALLPCGCILIASQFLTYSCWKSQLSTVRKKMEITHFPASKTTVKFWHSLNKPGGISPRFQPGTFCPSRHKCPAGLSSSWGLSATPWNAPTPYRVIRAPRTLWWVHLWTNQ